MVSVKSAINLSRVEKYISENPGAPFILFFQALLLTCAFLMTSGNLALANEVAVYAYITLVIGVVLQLFSFLKHGKERSQVTKGLAEDEPKVSESALAMNGEKPENPALTVVIPAYNEEGIIEGSIRRLKNDLRHLNLEYEIIVVDDGSTDHTYEVVRKMAAKNRRNVRLIHCERNGGKGEAFRRGYENSSGSYVLLRDADLVTPQNLLAEYLKKIRVADMVVASKRHPESKVGYGFYRSHLSRGFNLLVNVLFDLGLDDTQCGLKLFRREVLDKVMPRLLLKRYAFDVELLVNVRKKDFRVVTAPIVVRNLRERPMKTREIFRMAIDILAIFYRLHFTNTYD